MLFPGAKIIHEIPIYSMPEKEFKRRWDRWKKDWYEKSERMGYSSEQTEEVITKLMSRQYPRNVWKYNQIVGFVEIAVTSSDVVFNVQKTFDSKIHALGKRKHYIQDMKTNGLHFPINNMTNEEIVAKVDEYLQSIQVDLQGQFCLYLDTFNHVKHYIDYRGIQKGNASL